MFYVYIYVISCMLLAVYERRMSIFVPAVTCLAVLRQCSPDLRRVLLGSRLSTLKKGQALGSGKGARWASRALR